MIDFSENSIKKDCPHCNKDFFALKHPLEETKNFWIICDVHPIVEGHILIIPKKHLPCLGGYSDNLYKEFRKLYEKFSKFLIDQYKAVSTFEHGLIGQTVFHSHIHLLPFKGDPLMIIPEGWDKIIKLNDLAELKDIFSRVGKYLFFSIGDSAWTVDLSLGVPRFFRDRFAEALGRPERGNWKKMHENTLLMSEAGREINSLKKYWLHYRQS